MHEAICPSCGKRFPHGTTTCNWCSPTEADESAPHAEADELALNGSSPVYTTLHRQPSNCDEGKIGHEDNPLSTLVVRLTAGFIVWVVSFFLALLSLIVFQKPGFNSLLDLLLRLLTFVLPIWAIAGLFKRNS